MYRILSELLEDRKGGTVFTCFDLTHWICIFLVLGTVALSLVLLRHKDRDTRDRITRYFGNAAFYLYVADFFLMPFAYGEIDIDKLPFHACTGMCVMCFVSNHNRFLGKYRLNFALLGLMSNLCYLAYPAGVMWYEIGPLSYRVLQTLSFHGCMAVYGILTVVYHYREMTLKSSFRNLPILLLMTAWAFIGNTLYSGERGGYSHDFNWFFIKQDPFYLLPADISPYLAPVLNYLAFFAMEFLVYLICHAVAGYVDGKKIEKIA